MTKEYRNSQDKVDPVKDDLEIYKELTDYFTREPESKKPETYEHLGRIFENVSKIQTKEPHLVNEKNIILAKIHSSVSKLFETIIGEEKRLAKDGGIN